MRWAWVLALWAAPALALESDLGNLTVTEMASGLEEPWAVDFLPDGTPMITERGGQLWLIRDGRQEVTGVAEVHAKGQGGLLDVLVPEDFATSRTLFFTYAKPQENGAGTAVAKARLAEDGHSLSGWQDIFEMVPGSRGGQHFGSRLVEKNGTLFVTVGERGEREAAQDLGRENGSILRIAKDGSTTGNPFVDNPQARPAIWSYGHRNPQGAALDADGNLWVVEHGAQGGDEINLIKRGANYGWPVISYGRHYSGAKIGEGTAKEGMQQPAFYWDPSIAPSGMMIYSGKLIPEWEGDMFVGSLKFGFIARLEGAPLQEVERLKSEETGRVRDVAEAPDGSIWFLSVTEGAAYRITPAAR